MISQFENLTIEERDLLFKAPVLLSILASCSNREINKSQKADAIKLSHLKPFTADPSLVPFYVEVEKIFEQQFESISKQHSPFGEAGCDQLKNQVKKISPILKKLNRDYASKLLRSFEKYERHVKRAAHNVVEDFIFPVPIPGLNA
jgi:hypothetical protein